MQPFIRFLERDRRPVKVSMRSEPPVMNDAAVQIKVRHARATISRYKQADFSEVPLSQLLPVARRERNREVK